MNPGQEQEQTFTIKSNNLMAYEDIRFRGFIRAYVGNAIQYEDMTYKEVADVLRDEAARLDRLALEARK